MGSNTSQQCYSVRKEERMPDKYSLLRPGVYGGISEQTTPVTCMGIYLVILDTGTDHSRTNSGNQVAQQLHMPCIVFICHCLHFHS